MTSSRAYQPALPIDFAISEILRNAGTQFDPEVVEVFISLANVNRLPLATPA
jgi:HD-GYP domain-containing protein (c-di-GMP phosphodiesterase class II)